MFLLVLLILLAAPAPTRVPLLRGSGEGWTSYIVTCVGRSQLLKQNNNNTVIPCPQWLPLATMAFFGLLRAIHPFTLNHTAKCYTRHIQQPNIAHR